MENAMQAFDKESTKGSVSLKFPDIHAKPCFENIDSGQSSTRSSTSSHNELNKLTKDVSVIISAVNSNEKSDAELAEVKNELIKVIVRTLMINK